MICSPSICLVGQQNTSNKKGLAGAHSQPGSGKAQNGVAPRVPCVGTRAKNDKRLICIPSIRWEHPRSSRHQDGQKIPPLDGCPSTEATSTLSPLGPPYPFNHFQAVLSSFPWSKQEWSWPGQSTMICPGANPRDHHLWPLCSKLRDRGRVTEQLHLYPSLAGRSFLLHIHLIRGPQGTEAEQMQDFKIIFLQLCINILFQSCPTACLFKMKSLRGFQRWIRARLIFVHVSRP